MSAVPENVPSYDPKPVEAAGHVDAGEPVEGGLQGEVTLKRVLTARHLVLLGVGAIIGAGIFVMTGTAAADGSFDVLLNGELLGRVQWEVPGEHNRLNAVAAIAAARHVGVTPAVAIDALSRFKSVKRRMEVKGIVRDVTVYDDFAHHPTAIHTTLEGLRARVGEARILVAMEPRSNSMRLGAHAAEIAPSLAQADAVVFLHRPELAWDAGKVVAALRGEGEAVPGVDAMVDALLAPYRIWSLA